MWAGGAMLTLCEEKWGHTLKRPYVLTLMWFLIFHITFHITYPHFLHILSVSAQIQIAWCECWNCSICSVLSFISKSCYCWSSPLKFFSGNVTQLVRVQHVVVWHWQGCFLCPNMLAMSAWHSVLLEQMGIDPVCGGLVLACQPDALRAAGQRSQSENLPSHLDCTNRGRNM